MVRVSVFYPNESGVRFDGAYYAGRHRELVESRLVPLGLLRLEVDQGLAGFGGGPPPYVAAGHLYFDSVEAFQMAWEAHGPELLADIPNYTNSQPVVQISEIAVG